MNSLLNEQHKWIAEYLDFTSGEKAVGIDGAISQRCGEAGAMPIFEWKLGFLRQRHMLCSINYALLQLKSILNHILTVKMIVLQWVSFLSPYAVCFWTHQMACFAWADSASCLHCNSVWGVQRSRGVIEGRASCTLCTALFHPQVLIYTSLLLFSPLASHPPLSN